VRHILSAVSIAAILILPVGAMAGALTQTLIVTARVPGKCWLNMATDLNFGEYDTTSPDPTYGSSVISFYCTKGTSYWLYITGTRSMTSTTTPAEALDFGLYTDVNRTEKFPSIKTGSGTTADYGNQITNVYGKISAKQLVTVGNSFERILTAVIEW